VHPVILQELAAERVRATTARSPACSGRSATTSGSTSWTAWPACRPRDPTRHTRLGEARMHVISCQRLTKRFVVRVTTTIAAAPEQVWQVLTDLRRYRQWHPTLELLDGPPGGQLATGTVLRLRANGAHPLSGRSRCPSPRWPSRSPWPGKGAIPRSSSAATASPSAPRPGHPAGRRIGLQRSHGAGSAHRTSHSPGGRLPGRRDGPEEDRGAAAAASMERSDLKENPDGYHRHHHIRRPALPIEGAMTR
jgi:Polyketide cyclase / dehydrase and lipid transport